MESNKGIVESIIDSILSAIKDKSGKLVEDLNERREFTYEEALKYLLANKKDSPYIAKGAIVRETAPNGYIIYTVFLDSNNNLVENEKGIPFGCKRKARTLNIELQKAFKGNNVIVVE